MPINSPSVCAVNIRLNIPYMPASSTSTPHISGSTHTLEPDFLTLNDVAIEEIPSTISHTAKIARINISNITLMPGINIASADTTAAAMPAIRPKVPIKAFSLLLPSLRETAYETIVEIPHNPRIIVTIQPMLRNVSQG